MSESTAPAIVPTVRLKRGPTGKDCMSQPVITLHTVTGVDVELRIAGPGTRSYAFIIDWHIRLIMAAAVSRSAGDG